MKEKRRRMAREPFWNHESEVSKMYLLTTAIRAKIVTERRLIAGRRLRCLARAAYLRHIFALRILQRYWRKVLRDREERGREVRRLAVERSRAAVRIQALLRAFRTRYKLAAAKLRLQGALAAALIRQWRLHNTPLLERTDAWIQCFTEDERHILTNGQLFRAKMIILDLAATHAAAHAAKKEERKLKKDRHNIYLALKANSSIDLEATFKLFGLQGRFRKRRLVTILFESTRLASASARLVNALRKTLLSPSELFSRRSSSSISLLFTIKPERSSISSPPSIEKMENGHPPPSQAELLASLTLSTYFFTTKHT